MQWNVFKNDFKEMRKYLLLWFTQMISGMGSAMTAYGLVIWSYTQEGSALQTALLMVCSYTPYVLCSVFAGALSDRWNKKKVMLCCDALAALSTLAVFILLKSGNLRIWHLYVVNAVSGLMNTVQQPASEVATTVLLKRKYYQKVGSLRYLSNSLNSVLTPVVTTAVMSFWGLEAVIAVDLVSFVVAFVVLLFFVPIPEVERKRQEESILKSAADGLKWLRKNPGIFRLMLFLAGINLVASMFNAAFPALALTKSDQMAMGTVNTVTGITMLTGSVLSSLMKTPKSRVRAIWLSLMLSMGTENFFLAFGNSTWLWCLGAVLGWIGIPWMSANLETVNRLHIPAELQGRVFAARNSFQFFTIPLGYFLGGALVDRVFEPLMAAQEPGSYLVKVFGFGKGSGAALLFAVLWIIGIGICLIFRADKHIWKLDGESQ